jgi:predicted metal-binding membrane protein
LLLRADPLPRLTPHDRFFVPLFAGTVVVAWLALAVWDVSPYARYLEHDWTRLGTVASLCAALPAGEALVPASLYIAGWVLMTAAMMLPTTLPLVTVFRRLTMRQSGASALLCLLLAGYLAAWLGFGVAAHLLGLVLLELVQRSAWLTFNGWLIGALILLLAGLFQFSSLKYRCLDACRSPLAFISTRWSGRRPFSDSLRLGLAHGVYCVGCCWLLMLLMFAVGTGSIGWMLALGAVMALEKNSPWGRRLAAPLGLALIAAAVGVAAAHGLGSWPG